jgi:hypothetical protein
MITKCVRCQADIKQAVNPLAHWWTICQGCHNENPENISDQIKYNFDKYRSHIDNLSDK